MKITGEREQIKYELISGDSKLCGRKQDQEKVRQIGRK